MFVARALRWRLRPPEAFGSVLLGLARAVILALGVLASSPSSGAGQSTEAILGERRLEYQAARAAYEAARRALSVVESQFSAALDEVGRARRAGDEGALEDAFALARDRSLPYGQQQTRVNEVRDSLDSARRALIDVLTVRLQELIAQIDVAASAAQRAELNVLLTDLDNELTTLESEEGDTFQLEPVVSPAITFDPRDGPDDLRAKAELLERQAAVTDTVIADTERQIETLNGRLRTERQLRDFMAGADRFDDTRVPVVAGPPTEGRVPAADSTRGGAPALTLDERIEMLREYRDELQAYRDQLLIRADQFRRRIGSLA